MKKFIISLVFSTFIIGGVFFIVQTDVLAESVTFNNPFDNTNSDPTSSVTGIIIQIFKWVQRVAGVVAILMILVGGAMYLIGGFDQEKLKQANSIFKNVVIGLVVIFAGTNIVFEVIQIAGDQETISKLDENLNEVDPNNNNRGIKKVIEDATTTIVKYTTMVGVLVIIIAGIIYMTAANSDRHQMALKTIQFAIIGLFVVYLAWSIVSLIMTVLT